MGQLASVVGEREKGKFLNQPIPNPKGQYEVGSSANPKEEVKSVTTLRSGKVIDNHVHMPENEEQSQLESQNNDSSKKKREEIPYAPKAPIP